MDLIIPQALYYDDIWSLKESDYELIYYSYFNERDMIKDDDFISDFYYTI